MIEGRITFFFLQKEYANLFRESLKVDPKPYLTSQTVASPPPRVTQSLKAAFFARQVVHCSVRLVIRFYSYLNSKTCSGGCGVVIHHAIIIRNLLNPPNDQNHVHYEWPEFFNALLAITIYTHRRASNQGVIVNAMLQKERRNDYVCFRGGFWVSRALVAKPKQPRCKLQDGSLVVVVVFVQRVPARFFHT